MSINSQVGRKVDLIQSQLLRKRETCFKFTSSENSVAGEEASEWDEKQEIRSMDLGC